MLGIAIIGAGDIANIHIEAYQEFPARCEIRAIADLFRDKAQEKAEKYGLQCDVCADYKELAAREDIGLVSICLPPSMHCEVACAFLSAGKHVLCEKPMAPTLEECDRMLAAERQGGGKLSIVAQSRFRTDVMKTKQLLESGAAGAALFAQVDSFWWRGGRYYDLWWRGTWEKEGGGCTFIHAVHHIDLMLWLMGNVRELRATAANQAHDNSEVEDVSITTLRFESGARGVLTASLLRHGEGQRLVVDCQNATVEIPHRLSVSRQRENGYPEDDVSAQAALEQAFQGLPLIPYTEHCGQVENLLCAIENDTPPLVTGADGRRTIELISGIYQSAFTGTATTFPMTQRDLFYTREGILSKVVKFHEKTGSVENYADSGISVVGTH